MKSFFKKIALVLVLAMVVTMLPAKAVSAADTDGPQLSKQVKLYIGGDKTGSYSNAAYAKVWNKSGYTVEFSIDNEDVATVGKKKGLVEAVGVGTATVTAVFTNEDGETVEKTCKVVVKKNAVAVGISENSAKTLEEGLAVGETFQPKVFRTSADGETSWKGKEVITDGARFESSDEEVFTVKKTTGKITAVGAGEATLSVWTVQGEKPVKDEEGKVVEYLATTEKVEYPVKVVEVAAVVTGVTVKSVTELELAVTGVTADNVNTLKIMNVNGGDITSLFTAPVLSEDGTTVTVKKYFNLINDEELTFAFGDDEKGFTFIVKVGEAVAIKIEGPENAVIGKETEYSYKVIDENGIDLGVTSNVTLDINDKTYATISGSKLTMYQVGKSVTITATYNTGKLDANYMPITMKDEKVVTCIEQPVVTASAMTFMVGSDFKKDDLTADSISMYKGASTSRLYAQVALSAGDPINSKDNVNYFTFETLAPSVLLVESGSGYLTPVSVGAARVLVKFNNGMGVTLTSVATIYVREDQKVVSIQPDKNGVTLSNAIDVNESVKITIKGTDQYGNEFNQKVASEDVDWPNKNAGAVSRPLVVSDNTVTFNASGAAEGVYVYRIKCNDATTIVTINVRTPGQTVSYKVLVNDNKDKLEVNPADFANGTDAASISFRIVGIDSYGIASEVIKDAKDVAVKKGDTSATVSAIDENGVYTANFAKVETNVVSGCAIIVSVDNGIGYSVETGAYVISAVSATGRTVVPATVEVALTKTAAPAVKVDTSVIEHATKANYQDLIEALFKVDENNYQPPYIVWGSGDVVDPVANITNPKGQSYILVRNIKVYQKIDGVLVLHTVEVNRYISVNFD